MRRKSTSTSFMYVLAFIASTVAAVVGMTFFFLHEYQMNIFLFTAIMFLFIFLVGKLVEKIRVPWVFAALFLGALLAIYNPFETITSSQTFMFLAQLGMYFLLFMIGFEINLSEMKKRSRFIIKSTFFIIFLEAFFGSLIIHFILGYGWFISVLVALSFATVGEAILVPILDEFRILNTRLGQAIIGIGTLDDIIEVLTLVIVVVIIGSGAQTGFNIISASVSLAALAVLTLGIMRLRKSGRKHDFMNAEILFLFVLLVLFMFIGIGMYAESGALAALLAGLAVRSLIPEKDLKTVKNEIKMLTYGFFAPLFFLWVGLELDISYLISYPLLILLVVAVSKGSKILGSYIVAKDKMGIRGSVLLGIGLSVRFSTSIIVIKLLFDSGIVGANLYSIIVASSIIFKFIIPPLFSNLLVRWKAHKI